MWRIRKAFPLGWLVFVYCVLVYLLIGLDYATVYYSDINLFYVLIICIIYQVQLRISRAEVPADLASPQMIAQAR